MATLNIATDYKDLRKSMFSGKAKAVLKTEASLPSKDELFAVFQIIEDAWTAALPQMKLDAQTVLGRTATDTELKHYAVAWFKYKTDKYQGEV